MSQTEFGKKLESEAGSRRVSNRLTGALNSAKMVRPAQTGE